MYGICMALTTLFNISSRGLEPFNRQANGLENKIQNSHDKLTKLMPYLNGHDKYDAVMVFSVQFQLKQNFAFEDIKHAYIYKVWNVTDVTKGICATTASKVGILVTISAFKGKSLKHIKFIILFQALESRRMSCLNLFRKPTYRVSNYTRIKLFQLSSYSLTKYLVLQFINVF